MIFWGGFAVGEALIVLCSVTRAFFSPLGDL